MKQSSKIKNITIYKQSTQMVRDKNCSDNYYMKDQFNTIRHKYRDK